MLELTGTVPDLGHTTERGPRYSVVAIAEAREVLADLSTRLDHLGFDIVGTAPNLDAAETLECARRCDVVVVIPSLPDAGFARDLPRFIAEQDTPVVLLIPGDPSVPTTFASALRGCTTLVAPCHDVELVSVVRAVAEGTRARIAVRHEAATLGSIVRNVPHAVILCDARARVLLANPAAERLIGCASAGAVGRPVSQLLLLRDHDIAKRMAGGGDQLPVADSVGVAYGERRRVEVRTASVSLWRSPAGYLISIQDITERVRHVHQLAASEYRLAGIVELAQDSIVAIDARARIILFNRSAEKTFGYQREEVVGKHLNTLMPERFRWAHDRHMAQFARQPIATRFARERPLITALRKNGEEFQAETSISKIETDSGVIFTAFLRDMTESYHAEAVLRASEERFQTVFASSALGVVLLDPDGMILEENPAAQRIAERAAAATGRSFLDDVHADHQQSERRLFAELMAGSRDRYRVESQLDGGANGPTWVQATVSRMEPRRDKTAAVRLIEDLTERKTLEEQLFHAQKMDAMGRIAGGVAHDFNNLLTVITGYAQLLIETTPPQDERLTMAMEIRDAANRASSLSNQLLIFGRKQPLHREATDLDALAEGVMRMLERVLPPSIVVTVRLETAGRSINVDRGYMEQVIINLVRNACDAMGDAGDLTVSTGLRTVAGGTHPILEAGRYAVLTVEDSGAGMDEATRAKVFEPFFTTKPPGKGTGLGLSTVFGFVRKSGGDVEVSSTRGHGATFTLLLPLDDAGD